MGLGKEASVKETLHWPATPMWGGVAHMLGDYGPLLESRNVPPHSGCFPVLVQDTVHSTAAEK